MNVHPTPSYPICTVVGKCAESGETHTCDLLIPLYVHGFDPDMIGNTSVLPALAVPVVKPPQGNQGEPTMLKHSMTPALESFKFDLTEDVMKFLYSPAGVELPQSIDVSMIRSADPFGLLTCLSEI